ncbi:MAG TPA: hypothetical protein VM099_11650 [Gemmatimonadaceae bacterium]|nr:hypothetical protein [Gemmatimonadaceae bacterium]
MSSAIDPRHDLAGRDLERDDRATVAVFSSILSIVIGAAYYFSRSGFNNPPLPVVATVGYALFILATPFVAWRLIPRGHYEEPEMWYRSQAFFTLVLIAVTALAGMLVPFSGINIVWFFAVVGYASALLALAMWIKSTRISATLAVIVGAGVFALWAGGVAWSTRYKTPLFWETLEYKADVHHDPLYYVSMANSMRTYGVPSTGLDGVPYTPYHYGSAWLNSQWAYLSGVDVLGFYTLGPSVIVIPLFFAAVLMLAVEMKRGMTGDRSIVPRALRSDYAAWALFFAVSIGVIPSSGLDAMGIWNRHALISESYVIGLPVFLLILCIAVIYWRRQRTKHRVSDVVFLLLFAPAMLVVAGFLKVSTMLLLLAAGLTVFVLGRFYRDRVMLLSALICLVVSVVAFKLVSVSAQNQGIVPFSYMRYYVNAAWWPYFVLVHLFWTWVYVFVRLREEGVRTVGDVRQAAAHGRITDVVVLAVVAIAGWAAGEVIDIHGGSAVYFSDVQRWLALSLLMASASRWLAQRRADTTTDRRQWGSLRVSRAWMILLAIPISITLVLNAMRAPLTAFRAQIDLRRQLYQEAGVTAPVGIRDLGNHAVLYKGLAQSPAYPLISTLRQLGAGSPSIRARTAVFIPQSDTSFWHIWKEPERCSFVPLIVPATSGLALIDGMPPLDCNVTVQYGMTIYTPRKTPQLASDVTPQALCSRAKAKGFSRVVVVDGDANHVDQRIISCPSR